MTAVLAAAVGRGHLGLHRLDLEAPDAGTPEAARIVQLTEPGPVVKLPGLVRQPDSVTAASAHLSLVPVRRSPDPLLDTVPHPVVRLFPLSVAAPVPVHDEALAGKTTDEITEEGNVLAYRSRHSA